MHSSEPLAQAEFKKLIHFIDQKQKYITDRDLKSLPPCFDIGDEVGVFYCDPEPRHDVAVIVGLGARPDSPHGPATVTGR